MKEKATIVAVDDQAEVRRLLAGWAADFSEPQRRYVEQLLEAWERERGGLSSRDAPVD